MIHASLTSNKGSELNKSEKSEIQDKNQQVVKSAGSMSMGTALSRILGFLRDLVLAAFFSAMVRDAFVVAFRLPNMFRRLLGEGSLAVSFVPVFVSENSVNGDGAAKSLSDIIFTFLMVISSTLCVLGIVFIEPVIGVMVSGKGYISVPGKLDLTVNLARIMFSYLFLVTTYAYYMSVLNALKRFFVPAVAPAIFNLVFIIFAFVAQGEVLNNVMLLAWGVIAGGILQMLITAVALIKIGYLPKFVAIKITAPVKKVFLNILPGLIGLGVLQIMGLINIYFASELNEGSHSYIYFADRILELPNSLVAVSLSVALLPTLSGLWAEGKGGEMKNIIFSQIKLLLFLSLPCAVGMFLLSHEIVEVLFQHGQFGINDTNMTALVIKEYAFLLIAVGVVRILATSFHAIKNTTLPAVSSALTLVFHVIAAPILMEKYNLAGLVGSTVLSGYVNLFILAMFYKKYIGSFPYKDLFTRIFQFLIPLFFMGISTYLVNIGIQNFVFSFAPRSVGVFLSLSITILVSVAVYMGASHLMKLKEADSILKLFKRRLPSLFS